LGEEPFSASEAGVDGPDAELVAAVSCGLMAVVVMLLGFWLRWSAANAGICTFSGRCCLSGPLLSTLFTSPAAPALAEAAAAVAASESDHNIDHARLRYSSTVFCHGQGLGDILPASAHPAFIETLSISQSDLMHNDVAANT